VQEARAGRRGGSPPLLRSSRRACLRESRTERSDELESSFGWYDLSVQTDADRDFLRRLAGHLENGRDSASDPAFGRETRGHDTD